MTMMEEFPYETVVEILSLLSSADLACTIRVSHRFHAVSLALLYKAPWLANNPTPIPIGARSSLGIILRTLLTPGHDALGSHVRYLRLELDDTASSTEYSDDAMARINAIASKLSINNPLTTQGSHLMILLDLLPRLQALYNSPPNARFLEAARALLELPGFMRSLSLLRLTLQYLHLDFSEVTLPIEAEEHEFFLPYEEGSLREWPVLRTMICSLMPLLGKQVLHNSVRLTNLLPPGLRELEILQDWKWEVCDAVEHVVEMLAQKSYASPRLEKVAVVTSCRKRQRTMDRLTVA